MECKECGSHLKEDAAFCGVCGTKVEALANTCKKCGGVVSGNAKFCRHCGEVMGEEISATTEPIVTPVESIIPTEPATPKKGLSKKMIMGVMAIAVLIIAITQYKGSSLATASNDLNLMFFESYDNDLYAKSSGKKEYILKAADANQIVVSKDGGEIYSLDEDQNLYLQEGTKYSERIARDVQWMMISPSGNTVAYMEDNGNDYGKGTLYVKAGNSKPEKVSSEDCDARSVSISDNGKYVTFSEVDADAIRNFLYPVGKEKIKGGKQMSLAVNDRGTILSVSKDQDLYIMKKGKDPDKVMSEVEVVGANKDFSRLLVLDTSRDLYAYNGKNKEKVESDIQSILGVKGLKQHRQGYFWQLNTKEIDMTYLKDDKIYAKFDGEKSEKITGNYLSDLRISEDFTSMAYVNDGDLYIKRFNNNKLKIEEKIDTRVSKMKMDVTGTHIVYEKEGDLYYLAKGKTEGLKIGTKNDVRDFAVKKDGTIYYETRDEALFLTKGTSTGKKIADDVYEWEITEKAAYVLDYDDTVFEIIGKRKTEKIKDDVMELVKPIPNRYRLSLY